MDVIIELKDGWREGNYFCTQSQYDFLNEARIKVGELPGFAKLIIGVPAGEGEGFSTKEIAISVCDCDVEVFPEDDNGARSFFVLKVPARAVELR